MSPGPAVRSWAALGTTATVAVRDPEALGTAAEAVAEEVRAIDAAASRFRADSEISRLNDAAGRAREISPLFAQALRVALDAARATDGDVDPTVGESMVLAGYDRDFAALGDGPAPILRAALVRGPDAVTLDEERLTARVAPGVRLDLGATAKALAADRAAAVAATVAGCGVLVSLGGDLAIAGEAPPEGWSVRMSEDHAETAAGPCVALLQGGLATSSVTVRAWTRGGRQMHHIIDPATGAPARAVWRTASVAAASCVQANTAATAAIVRGERAEGWLTELGLPARLVHADGTVRRLAGWPEEELVA